MRSILQTTDPVLVSYVDALLKEAGIPAHIADANISAVEGSIGIFPRRVLVADQHWNAAHRLLADAGLEKWMSAQDTGAAGATD